MIDRAGICIVTMDITTVDGDTYLKGTILRFTSIDKRENDAIYYKIEFSNAHGLYLSSRCTQELRDYNLNILS